MNLLFSTFDLHRKKAFVAITSIYEEGNKRFVVKTPLFEEGKAHLQRFVDAYPLLSKAFGKGSVAQAKAQGEQIQIEFVEGKSLTSLLLEAYRSQDVERIEALLSKYRDFLLLAQDDAKTAPRFASYRIPGPILAPADIDLIFDNIIEKENGQLCIIDYEWSEQEGIPFQLIAYRAISRLANRQADLGAYPFEKLLAFFGISKAVAKSCEKATNDFVSSVLNDETPANPETHYIFSAIADYERGREELYQQINEKNAEINDVKNELNISNDHLAQTKNELNVTNQRLNEANETISRKDGELNQIKSSRGYRMLKRWYKFRDWMLPKGSKRRLFVKAGLYAIRHPVITWKAILRGKGKDFFRAAKTNPDAAFSKVENYHQKMEEKGDLTNLVLYKEKEFTPFSFPECEQPLVSIIIPVYNQFFYTYNCLKAVLENTDMRRLLMKSSSGMTFPPTKPKTSSRSSVGSSWPATKRTRVFFSIATKPRQRQEANMFISSITIRTSKRGTWMPLSNISNPTKTLGPLAQNWSTAMANSKKLGASYGKMALLGIMATAKTGKTPPSTM